MLVDVVTQTRIARPPAVVAEYASDPNNAPEWYDNIQSVQWESEPPLRVGSRMAFVARFLGKRLAYTYEVTEYTPSKLLRMQTAQGPFPMETVYEFTRRGNDETEMRLQNRGEPAGFSRLMAPLMVRAMRSANEKDLAKLKQLLEER